MNFELYSNSTKFKLTIGSRFNPISNEKKLDANWWKSWKPVCEYGVSKKKTLKRHKFEKTAFHACVLENGQKNLGWNFVI